MPLQTTPSGFWHAVARVPPATFALVFCMAAMLWFVEATIRPVLHACAAIVTTKEPPK